jgi:hypothetical protein
VRAWNGSAFEESLVTRYERMNDQWGRIEQVRVDQAAADALAGNPQGSDARET